MNALATVPTPRLSEQLAALVRAFGERPMRLQEVVQVLRGRAYTLLLLVLALPFCTPIPLPGLSTPFGIVIALLGFRIALNQRPWLPGRLLGMTLPAKFFARVLSGARRVVGWLERFLRPRLSQLVQGRFFRHGCGIVITICGLLLLLPLPIPLSNTFPAMTVVLMAGAMLEDDGGCMLAGLVAFALTLCFYGALAWGGLEGVSAIRDWASLNLPRF